MKIQNGTQPARVLKTTVELKDSLETIMNMRRTYESDDTIPIGDRQLRRMFDESMYLYMDKHLSTAQAQTSLMNQKHLWLRHLRQNFGSEHFVMALWQTGLLCAPPRQMMQNDITGAVNHVTDRFEQWCQQMAYAAYYHKKNPLIPQ